MTGEKATEMAADWPGLRPRSGEVAEGARLGRRRSAERLLSARTDASEPLALAVRSVA